MPRSAHRCADQLEDLLARAHVDALRRLVEQEEARLGLEPLREQRLLLVAAAQRAVRQRRVGRPDVEVAHHGRRLAAHAPALERDPVEVAVEDGERHVLADRQRADAAVVLPVGRDQRDAGRVAAGGVSRVRSSGRPPRTRPPARAGRAP